MPVYRLSESLDFPSPHDAEPDGLLAVGGDLSPPRLLLAYRHGIFPWYSQDTPILWWSPNPRLVLFPEELKIAKSLQRVVRKGRFTVTFDRDFGGVIRACAAVRRRQGEGTWLVPEMILAYSRLHELGYAHSVESWFEGRLVGGLYGVALGRVFFGESMFTTMPDASKVAFVHLVDRLAAWGFEMIDCQVTTHHLQRFGAREISRSDFLSRLRRAVNVPPPRGAWEPAP
jgi:leucyl/phenylalanyl-tRNA--protein transferase